MQEYLQDSLERLFHESLHRLGPRPARDDYGRFDGQIQRLTDALRLSVTVRGRNKLWEHSGEIGEALESIDDLREVEEITLRNMPLGEVDAQVEVRFRNDKYSDAVTAEVRGSDKTWVDGMYEDLRQRLVRGRPWWAFMANFWFALAAGALTAAAILATLFVLFPDGSLTKTQTSLIWIAWWIFLWVAVGSTPYVLAKMLPKFEVLPPGQGSTGGRRLRVALGVVGFMTANLVIPIVLAVLMN